MHGGCQKSTMPVLMHHNLAANKRDRGLDSSPNLPSLPAETTYLSFLIALIRATSCAFWSLSSLSTFFLQPYVA